MKYFIMRTIDMSYYTFSYYFIYHLFWFCSLCILCLVLSFIYSNFLALRTTL